MQNDRVLAFPVSAEDVGAPHRRRRIFVVGHTNRQGEPTIPVHGEVARVCGNTGDATHADGVDGRSRTVPQKPRGQAWRHSQGRGWDPPVSPVCGVDDGIPHRVDRLRALGNAVVPQCAEVIGYVVQELMGPAR